MATGPEHYIQGEQLLAKAGAIPANHDETNPAATLLIAEAHVHMTAALTEAIVASAVMRPEDRDAWDRATGRLEGRE